MAKSGYKMSMIRSTGKRDFFGEFPTKESAEEMVELFKELDSDYVDADIWYFEK